jgi:hypothetical protein
MTRAIGGEMIREALRVLVGIALLILLVGIWACLWVPPTF